MRTGRILALPLVAAALAAAVSTINGDTPKSATQHPTELGFAGDAYVNEGVAPDRVLALDVEFYVEGLTFGSSTDGLALDGSSKDPIYLDVEAAGADQQD